MGAVNWLLINIASAALWLWGGVEYIFVAVFSTLDSLLNPVLSPLLGILNPICTAIGDAVYAVIGLFPIWLGLTLVSVIAGVLMLLVFRYTSNQEAIGWAKDDIKANLLALKLFKEDLGVTLRAQCRLLWAVGRLQRYMFTPFLIMLLPMLLGLAQMAVRYQWRPLHPGEEAFIKMKLAEDHTNPRTAELEPGEAVSIEVGSVPGAGEIAWRVRGRTPGRHALRFRIGDSVVEKELVVGKGFERVSAERPGHRWTAQLLHPVEGRLPADSPVESIVVEYPSRDSYIHGEGWWLLTFFVVSLIAALVLSPVFKVRF